LLANDSWFRPVSLKYGPDGSVYLIDWYDKQACHDTTPERWDRTNGRLYRVSYGKPKPVAVDLRKRSGAELADLLTDKNDWYARQSRLILAERGQDNYTASKLRQRLGTNWDVRVRLRALWAMHASQNATAEDYLGAFRDKSEDLQAWALQLTSEGD